MTLTFSNPVKFDSKVRTLMSNNRSFYLYQISDILFTSSTRAFGMLFSWWMIEILKLELKLGWFIFFCWLFQILFLIKFGEIGDKINKRSVVLYCTIPSFILFVISNLLDSNFYLSLGLIYIATSVATAIIQPIGISIIPEIMDNKKLDKAFKYRGLVNSINTMLGPAISGLIIHYFNIDGSLIFIAVMSLLPLIGFYFIKTNSEKKPEEAEHRGQKSIRIITKNSTEIRLSFVAAFFNFAITPLIMYILPIIILNQFKLSALHVGIAEATFGIGMMLGSLVIINQINKIFCKAHTAFIAALTMALCIAGISHADSFTELCCYMLICGIGLVIYNINTTSIRCLATPENYRNSMESKFTAICMASIPLGMLTATYIIESYDIKILLLGFSFFMALISLLILSSPKYIEISKMSESQLNGYYEKIYPEAFYTKK
nr:MFS transporter [Xenorhabdus sp. KJ12.1]